MSICSIALLAGLFGSGSFSTWKDSKDADRMRRRRNQLPNFVRCSTLYCMSCWILSLLDVQNSLSAQQFLGLFC